MTVYTSTLMSRGRTTLPKGLMQELSLPNGGLVVLENAANGSAILRPATDDELAAHAAAHAQGGT